MRPVGLMNAMRIGAMDVDQHVYDIEGREMVWLQYRYVLVWQERAWERDLYCKPSH